MAHQSCVEPIDVTSFQFAPESDEVQMLPPLTTAASFSLFELDATAHQFFSLVFSGPWVQFAPEFDDVQMLPMLSPTLFATATSLSPFELDAMLIQALSFQSPCSLLTQVSPEFDDVQMWSLGEMATAASLLPSELELI